MRKLPLYEKGNQGQLGFSSYSSAKTSVISFLLIIVVVCMFLLLIVRLFQLTVVKGVYYRSLADSNRIREVVIEPQRGKIIDRKGAVLVESSPADVHGVTTRLRSYRKYSNPEVFAHVIGYRQPADENDLKNDTCINKIQKKGVTVDKVGKKGVERLFDCELRGINGKKLTENNASGEYEKTLSIVDPVPGATLQLAIDGRLQEKAYETIKGQKAAVVAMKPTTGEVLALVSSPTFNPQLFEDGKNQAVANLFTDNNRPLFNRATEGVYPPGSTFKMVVAAAGLEDGKVLPTTTIEDKGVLQAGNLKFHNWYFLQYGRVDGLVDVYKALQRSNDIYFYLIGDKVGPERMKFWAEEFGYQTKTGIGIGEAEGTIPSSFWKEDVLKEKWFLGDTYNMSIGQGYITATPLQVTVATMPFANGGFICEPHMVKFKSAFSQAPKCRKVKISTQTREVIREGMRQACAAGGTGWPFFDFKIRDPYVTIPPTPVASVSGTIEQKGVGKRIEVGCKTGTAESQSTTTKPHAWFTVFAPYENPEVVLTVLVENGGQGSDVAGSIAKDILKDYFERGE